LQQIFSTLTEYGRLSIPQLKDYSELSRTQLEHGLSAMIQMHLVYHHTKGVNTYYEANIKDAYYLVRSGKILKAIQDRLGRYAANVMFMILSLGHAQVRYLETLPVPELHFHIQTNGVNGHTTEDDTKTQANPRPTRVAATTTNGDRSEESLSRLHRALRALATRGYILRVRDAHFQSDMDNRIDAERRAEQQPDIQELKGKKRAAAIEQSVNEYLHRITDSDICPRLTPFTSLRGDKRPYVNGIASPRKRSKLDDQADDDGEDGEEAEDGGEDEDYEDDDSLEVKIILSCIFRS
jgi:DNA-directed RNA polymerase III subunit RPC3